MKIPGKIMPFFIMLIPALVEAAEPDTRVRQEIRHLLTRLESSQCQFNRNGSWYSSSDAKAHLTKKYNYLLEKGLIATTQSFIEQAASQSSMSGQAYWVKCGHEKPVQSAQWLGNELLRYQHLSAK